MSVSGGFRITEQDLRNHPHLVDKVLNQLGASDFKKIFPTIEVESTEVRTFASTCGSFVDITEWENKKQRLVLDYYNRKRQGVNVESEEDFYRGIERQERKHIEAATIFHQ